MPDIPQMDDATSSTMVFGTYLEAHQEVVRRRSGNTCDGMIHKVANAPYGDGYVVRSCPVALLVGTEFGRKFRNDRASYTSM